MFPRETSDYVRDAFNAWFKVFAHEAESRIRISVYGNPNDLDNVIILPPNLEDYDEDNDPQGLFNDVGECYGFSNPVFDYATIKDGIIEVSEAVNILIRTQLNTNLPFISGKEFGEALANAQFSDKDVLDLGSTNPGVYCLLMEAPKLDLTYDGESAGFKQRIIPEDDDIIAPSR